MHFQFNLLSITYMVCMWKAQSRLYLGKLNSQKWFWPCEINCEIVMVPNGTIIEEVSITQVINCPVYKTHLYYMMLSTHHKHGIHKCHGDSDVNRSGTVRIINLHLGCGTISGIGGIIIAAP